MSQIINKETYIENMFNIMQARIEQLEAIVEKLIKK